MMKKGTITRIIVNGVLLAAIIALGITLFQSKPQTKEAVPETEKRQQITRTVKPVLKKRHKAHPLLFFHR